jgi:diadenosine tetraphosphatase ApaH/serine/threonine PP2A family protein phosphatase
MLVQVNGWEMHYMEKSFLHQCKERFGVEVGEHVWEECNQAFDRLPLAAVIDHEIFCIHGGFPRPIHVEDGDEGETQLLVSSPRFPCTICAALWCRFCLVASRCALFCGAVAGTYC